MRDVLADRGCRRLLAAHGLSSLGDGAAAVALALLAYRTAGSAWGVTCALLAGFLPAALLSARFGALSDRVSRRRIAVSADIVRALAYAGLCLVGSLAAVCALALLAGVATSAFRPTVRAAMPAVAPDGRTLAALGGGYSALRDLGFVAGPALCGLAVLTVGLDGAFALNAVTFAISALLLTGVGALDRPRASSCASSAPGAPAGVSWRVAGVPLLISCSALVVLIGGQVNVAEPLLAGRVFGSGDAGYAWLAASYGLGTAAASLTLGRELALRHAAVVYGVAVTICGLGMAGAALAPSLGLACAAFAAAGAGNGALVVQATNVLQRLVPDGQLGRAFGVKESVEAGAFVIAVLTGGALCSVLGVRALIAGAGLAVAAVGVLVGVRLAARLPAESTP